MCHALSLQVNCGLENGNSRKNVLTSEFKKEYVMRFIDVQTDAQMTKIELWDVRS